MQVVIPEEFDEEMANWENDIYHHQGSYLAIEAI